MSGIVIVGAGQAGASLAARLRALGHHGPVTLIGEEPVAPYQRPPLSKGYLMGEMDLDRLFLSAHGFWDEQSITLKLGQQVTAIDRDGTHGGPDLALYERLLAAGQGSIIASAGIATVEDIAAVRTSGCSGAIIGRALYDGRLSIDDALQA